MAEEKVDSHPQQSSILGDVAADEASIDVEIEMTLQRYQALYWSIKMKDVEIAAKREKNKQLDELIEAKKSELDRIVQEREDIQKRTAYFRHSTENNQKLLSFMEKERLEKQKQRESIAARYQVLIDRRKEKINSYPLVVERNKLRNELLAVNVELAVLKYRTAEKKRQQKQRTEIQKQLLNNAIIKMAEKYMEMKKVEEDHLKLLQELEKAKSSPSRTEKKNETNLAEYTARPTELDYQPNDSSLYKNEQPMQPIRNDTKTIEINEVLKNFREKFHVKMRSSSVLLPPVLSIDKQRNINTKSSECEKSEQVVISLSNNENMNKMESTVMNSTETPKIDKECNQNESAEVLSRQDESAKNSDVSNESEIESNLRLRNALIATKSRNKTTASFSDEKKRALTQDANPYGAKYMKTDNFVALKRPRDSDNTNSHQRPACNPIEHQGRGGTLYRPVAHHSAGSYSNRRPSVQKILSAAKTPRKMEYSQPKDIESHNIGEENNFVSSTYFHGMTTKRNEKSLPLPAQGLGYNEYDENVSNHEGDEPNPHQSIYPTRIAEKRYSNYEDIAGERTNAEEEYVDGEQAEYIAEDEYPAQFGFPAETGVEYENCSDHDDEMNAEDEFAGTPFRISGDELPVDGGYGLHRSSNNSSKGKSSYEGVFADTAERPNFDRGLFDSPEERSNLDPFNNMFGNGKSNSPQNFF